MLTRWPMLTCVTLLGLTGCKDGAVAEKLKHLPFFAQEAKAKELHAEVASDEGADGSASGEQAPSDVLPLDPHAAAKPSKPAGKLTLDECRMRGAEHRSIDVANLHLQGTITGRSGPSVAMMNDGEHANQILRVGDYFGSHCWRVREIGMEHVLLEQPYIDAMGDEQFHVARLAVGDVQPKNVITNR